MPMTLSTDRARRNAHNNDRPHSRARRWLAVGMYLGLLSLVTAVMTARTVSAELHERSLTLGHRFGAFQEFAGRVTDVTWNGQHLSASTLTVDRPLAQVLSRFVGLCKSDTRALAADLAQRLRSDGEVEVSAVERALVLHDSIGDREGTAVCLAGAGSGGLPGLLDRVGAFAKTSDLNDIGQLRYVYARRVDAGTHVIFVAADGPLRFDRLFPLDGRDADGGELVPGTRPRDSVRFIAAHALGTPHALTAYRSAQSSAAVLADYRRQLEAKGFTAIHWNGPRAEGPVTDTLGPGVFTVMYMRGDQTLIATSQPDDDGEDGSLLSVVQLSQRPVPTPWRMR